MQTKKRKSESITVGITELQFKDTLAKYVSNINRLQSIEAEMNEALEKVKAEFEDDIELITKEQDLLFSTVKGYVVANQASLIGKDRRSFETLNAKIGFRTSTPKVALIRGWKWEGVLEAALTLAPVFVRTVNEVNKDAILQYTADDSESLLSSIGVKVTQDEKFFIDAKKEEVQ